MTDTGELRGRVARGVAWKASSSLFLQVTRFTTAIVLARLLSPGDYGVAGMVLIASGLVYILSDLALGAALVQRRELTDEDRSTVFWTCVGAGLVFTLVGVAVSGPIARFYGEPAVQPLFAVFSLNFLLTSLASTQSALLTRELGFKALELRRMASFVVGGAIGISLAAAGLGAWAIVGQQLAITAVSTILLAVFSPWRPAFSYSLASLRRLGGFGRNVVATQLLFYGNRNLDNLLVGRFLGPAALGAYSVSYNVMLMPFSQIASPIQEVLFPAFSRLQDDADRIAAVWLRVNRAVGALTIPGLLGLIAVAPDFVHVVLGDRWRAAVPVMQILSWVGLLQSLQRFNSSILEARNRTGILLGYAAVALAASVAAFVFGLRYGIVGVAAGYAIACTFVEPFYAWLTGREIGVSLQRFAHTLAGVFAASLVMFLTVLGARMLLVAHGTAAGVRLPVLIALGIAVYVPLCALFEPELVGEARRLRPGGARSAARLQATLRHRAEPLLLADAPADGAVGDLR